MKKKLSLLTSILIFIFIGISYFSNISNTQSDINPITKEKEIINTFSGVSNYIKENKKLPENFIKKDEAEKLGWDSSKGNLNKVAPGKSIGGDIFKNFEKKLPVKSGRIWYECDINYFDGFRGSDRIVYSNDGLIYKTMDHYKTFVKID